MSKILWGIDLGGTKIEGVVFEANPALPPIEIARLRIPTEQEKGYRHILSQIKLLVEQLETTTNTHPSAIGFGTPGVLDPKSNKLKNSNTACLRRKPLKSDLEQILNCTIAVANDANCFALAEHTFGASQGYSCSFGVIMGTGVGGGLIVNNLVRHGLQGISGEWGHSILDPEGPLCYCGKKGCVETFISGPALENFYFSISGQKKSLDNIVAHCSTDQYASQTIMRLEEYFSRAISNIINIIDPDIIVLGGGLSNIDVLYEQTTKEKLEQFVFNDDCLTPIVKNQLGDSAGVFGAALLVA